MRTSCRSRPRSSGWSALIADRRELYNDQVYRYNTRIAQFPGVVLAGLFGWRRRDFFAAGEGDRTRPDVSLRPA